MTQQSDTSEVPPTLPALKIEEQDPDPKKPWSDDKLGRQEIADRLTGIVRGQEAPFVISVDGRWGTGKTFLLRRWAQDLQNQGSEAIYFNAWEDDFNDDPLLAIIGQLSEYFDEGALREIARGVASALGHVLVKRVTGASPNELTPDSLLNDYREGLRTKRAVKDRLEQLGAQVREETGQPLVFIIDELDRCRPTFAIELLERVKHIFDVPNIVFVFGINRGELVKSLESVYGEIDAGTYLRRFFDMEFILPDANPVAFCHHLLDRFGLNEFFSGLMKAAQNNSRGVELDMISRYLPVIASNINLSLRDIDYCVRVLALAARDLPVGRTSYPALLVVLVALKVGNRDLYRRFVERTARGAELIDYIAEPTRPRMDRHLYLSADGRRVIDHLSAAVYCADDAEIVQVQLGYLSQGVPLDRPEYLAEEHASLGSGDPDRIQRIADVVGAYAKDLAWLGTGLEDVAEKIDLYHGMTRR